MSKEKQPNESSALKNIVNAGAEGASSPSIAVQVAASAFKHTPPGAESVVAQGLQAGLNMAVAGSKEFMAGTIKQYGRSPSVVLQDLKIQQSIDNKTPSNQPATNKGIEAARKKASVNQSEKSSNQSTNKGIENYRNRAAEQSKENSNSNVHQSSGSGQER